MFLFSSGTLLLTVSTLPNSSVLYVHWLLFSSVPYTTFGKSVLDNLLRSKFSISALNEVLTSSILLSNRLSVLVISSFKLVLVSFIFVSKLDKFVSLIVFNSLIAGARKVLVNPDASGLNSTPSASTLNL